jgi:hypothetical protein
LRVHDGGGIAEHPKEAGARRRGAQLIGGYLIDASISAATSFIGPTLNRLVILAQTISV